MSRLILASASPRRRLLLSAAGYTFDVIVPGVDESALDGEDPAAMVLRLSSLKAKSITSDGAVVIAADTVVVRDGVVIGKPLDRPDAIGILAGLQGRTHSVLTGWTVALGDDERFGVAESVVRFHPRTLADIEGYVDRTEPYDYAGAYALQGDDGWLVDEVIGSRANVMGLPLADVVAALSDFGVERSDT